MPEIPANISPEGLNMPEISKPELPVTEQPALDTEALGGVTEAADQARIKEEAEAEGDEEEEESPIEENITQKGEQKVGLNVKEVADSGANQIPENTPLNGGGIEK